MHRRMRDRRFGTSLSLTIRKHLFETRSFRQVDKVVLSRLWKHDIQVSDRCNKSCHILVCDVWKLIQT